MTDASSTPASHKGRNFLLQAVGGAAFGAVVGGTAAHFDLFDQLDAPDPFLGLALVMGTLLLILGASLVSLSYRPEALGKVLLETSTEAATRGERTFIRLGGWSMLLAGLLAAAPPLAVVWPGALPGEAAWLVLAVVTALTLVQIVANVRTWRWADELTRRATLEGSSLAFILVEGLLFLWAAAEVLGRAPAVSAWAIWTLMFAAYIVICGWVSWRRGVG